MKPGYQTTEFWVTIVTTLFTVLLMSGAISPGEKDSLQGAAINLVTLGAQVLANGAVIWKYIQSRAMVKSSASLQQAVGGK